MQRTSSFTRIVLAHAPAHSASIHYVFTPDDGMSHAQLELSDDDRARTGLPRWLGLSYGREKGSGRPVTQELPIDSPRTLKIDLGPIKLPEPFKRAAREFDHSVLDETGKNGPSCTTFVRFMLDKGDILRIPPWNERMRPAQLGDTIVMHLRREQRPAEIEPAPRVSDVHHNDGALAPPPPTPAPPPCP